MINATATATATATADPAELQRTKASLLAHTSAVQATSSASFATSRRPRPVTPQSHWLNTEGTLAECRYVLEKLQLLEFMYL